MVGRTDSKKRPTLPKIRRRLSTCAAAATTATTATYAAAATTHLFLGAEASLGCNTSQHTSSEFHLENINPDRFIPSLDYREGVEKSEFLSRLFKAQNRVFKTRLGNLGLSPKKTRIFLPLRL